MKKIKFTHISIIALVIIFAVAAVLFISLQQTMDSFRIMQENINTYNACHDAFDDVKDASATLTDEARYFVTTGDRTHLELYLYEDRVVKRRDNALEVIGQIEGNSEVYRMLENATENSNELMRTEVYAMQLAALAYGVETEDLDLDEYGVSVTESDLTLSAADKKEKAVRMMFDDNYIHKKSVIVDNVYEGVEQIIENDRVEAQQLSDTTHALMVQQYILVVILAVLLVLVIAAVLVFVLLPLRKNIKYIKDGKLLPAARVAELAYFAEAYNTLHRERQMNIDQLSYEASHDVLTGVYNRKMFEEELEALSNCEAGMLLVDVDYFKSINDTYGHDIGDKVLQTVASCLSHAFRSDDFVFRLGGDEFAVLLRSMKPEFTEVLLQKIGRMRRSLAAQKDIPEVTLSIGAAFHDGKGEVTLYKKADLALYEAKEAGRNRTAFYEPDRHSLNEA